MTTLTKGEEQVMQVLWKLQQGFLKDILANSPEPRPHSNTLATLLKILVAKGFVGYVTQGRNNLYKPLLGKQEYAKKCTALLVKSYFEGSAARLVAQLANDNKLSPEELEAILQQMKTHKKPD